MTEEWFLSPSDVAEALGCTRADVMDLIARGEIVATPGRRTRIPHSEVRTYVQHMQIGAFTLGRDPLGNPNLLASQPTVDVDD